jgi:glycosyltransferase involved in cell wall biosynthesis
MRIAFYAPMKPPDHPVPSGDRQAARALAAVLERQGHTVSLASNLSSWCAAPDAVAELRLAAAAAAERTRILAADGPKPELWFTYHLYHKAPDLLGPEVAAALGIPYVVAEASRALKRAADPWASRFAAVDRALAAADAVVAVHGEDAEGLAAVAADGRLHLLPPFLDTAPFERLPPEPIEPPGPCRLLAVGMMRPGAKLASYQVLAAALGRLRDRDWRLEIVGDGPERATVETAFRDAGVIDRVAFRGELPIAAMPACYRAADVVVWPAVKEAYGFVVLEAGAAGRPIVAADRPGVAAIVADGTTGLLVAEGDAGAFAAALARLLNDPGLRRSMGRLAARRIAEHHSLASAGTRLETIIGAALRHHAGRDGPPCAP